MMREDDVRRKSPRPPERVFLLGGSDRDLRFRVSEESHTPIGFPYVQHGSDLPHIFENTFDALGPKFTVYTETIVHVADVVPDVAVSQNAGLVGWNVGFVQNIVAAEEFVRYSKFSTDVAIPADQLPVADTVFRDPDAFPWVRAEAVASGEQALGRGGVFGFGFGDAPAITLPYNFPARRKKTPILGNRLFRFLAYTSNERFVTYIVARYEKDGVADEPIVLSYCVWDVRLHARLHETTDERDLTGVVKFRARTIRVVEQGLGRGPYEPYFGSRRAILIPASPAIHPPKIRERLFPLLTDHDQRTLAELAGAIGDDFPMPGSRRWQEMLAAEQGGRIHHSLPARVLELKYGS